MEIIAVIDPVTRLEGHLKINITIDTVDGVQKVVDARATGSLFRGFEKLLQGRDPRDAQHITERICGVCPVAHGLAAVRTLDAAYDVAIPPNARLMRNLVAGANYLDSHILHFYLLSLPDFISTGAAKTPWRVEWNGDRRLSRSQNDGLAARYLEALGMRRRAHEAGAIFGGRLPHPPAFVPGGFTATPRAERVADCQTIIEELIPFIRDALIPDAELLAARYPDYFSIGRGHGELLSYGVFDLDDSGTNKLLSPGTIAGGNVKPFDVAQITEQVRFSWFSDKTNGLAPSRGETVPENPKIDAYSWLKAPRYGSAPQEVGPLARMIVNGDYAGGVSVMDRHVARAREALKIALAMREWADELDPAASVYEKPTLRASVSAHGLTEAPRGALGHWLEIGEDGKIARYQVITPTTWNASPRDSRGTPGPLEQALLGVPVANADEPIEVLRVIHSFDPCLDCATHVARPGEKAKITHINSY